MATGQGILGNNMFAYCRNNPVMRCDPTGELDWESLFEGTSLMAIGLTACLVAATVVTGGACAPLLAVAAVTFVAGGVTVMNGAAEVIESTTGYNYMRDGLYQGNEQFYEGQKRVYSTVAEIGTIALGMGGSNPALCFVGGTMVLTAEGAQAIETVKAGDYVWAWDEETGEVALKEVVETYVNQTDELVHVFVNGEEIIATPAHPFYSPVKGWTEAVRLRAGDILVLVNGKYVVVEKVQHEILEAPVTVYNFQVADFHTYYVADSGVLVHNRCGGESLATRRGRQMHNDWDYGPGVAKEEIIGSGARVDGIDYINHIVYELKPNNPRAIRLGLKQLDRYLAILGVEDWAGVLVLYD